MLLFIKRYIVEFVLIHLFLMLFWCYRICGIASYYPDVDMSNTVLAKGTRVSNAISKFGYVQIFRENGELVRVIIPLYSDDDDHFDKRHRPSY